MQQPACAMPPAWSSHSQASAAPKRRHSDRGRYVGVALVGGTLEHERQQLRDRAGCAGAACRAQRQAGAERGSRCRLCRTSIGPRGAASPLDMLQRLRRVMAAARIPAPLRSSRPSGSSGQPIGGVRSRGPVARPPQSGVKSCESLRVSKSCPASSARRRCGRDAPRSGPRTVLTRHSAPASSSPCRLELLELRQPLAAPAARYRPVRARAAGTAAALRRASAPR